MKFNVGPYKVDLGAFTFSRIMSVLLILGFVGLLAYNSTL